MKEKIFYILSHHAGFPVSLHTKLSDMPLDSLDLVELSFDLESEFNIKLPSSEWDVVFHPEQTVSGIVEFLKIKTGKRVNSTKPPNQ